MLLSSLAATRASEMLRAFTVYTHYTHQRAFSPAGEFAQMRFCFFMTRMSIVDNLKDKQIHEWTHEGIYTDE